MYSDKCAKRVLGRCTVGAGLTCCRLQRFRPAQLQIMLTGIPPGPGRNSIGVMPGAERLPCSPGKANAFAVSPVKLVVTYSRNLLYMPTYVGVISSIIISKPPLLSDHHRGFAAEAGISHCLPTQHRSALQLRIYVVDDPPSCATTICSASVLCWRVSKRLFNYFGI